MRDATAVAERMRALFAVALRAEILAAGDPPPSLAEMGARLPGLAAALSPQELEFSSRRSRIHSSWPTSAGATKAW